MALHVSFIIIVSLLVEAAWFGDGMPAQDEMVTLFDGEFEFGKIFGCCMVMLVLIRMMNFAVRGIFWWKLCLSSQN